LSSNLGTSASWNLQGLSRPVLGFLYLFYIENLCEVTKVIPVTVRIKEVLKVIYFSKNANFKNCIK